MRAISTASEATARSRHTTPVPSKSVISSVDVRPAQAGLARICGVSRSAIWYRVQEGHLRPDENGLLDVSRARQALQRGRSRIIIPYNERDLLKIEKLKLIIKPVPLSILAVLLYLIILYSYRQFGGAG